MSAGEVDELMDIWATSNDVDLSLFSSHEHMYATIDEIKHGDTPCKSFTVSYAGHLGPDPLSWQLQDYWVWYCDPDIVTTNMLDNPDFNNLIMLHMWRLINQVSIVGMNRCQEILLGVMWYVLFFSFLYIEDTSRTLNYLGYDISR